MLYTIGLYYNLYYSLIVYNMLSSLSGDQWEVVTITARILPEILIEPLSYGIIRVDDQKLRIVIITVYVKNKKNQTKHTDNARSIVFP